MLGIEEVVAVKRRRMPTEEEIARRRVKAQLLVKSDVPEQQEKMVVQKRRIVWSCRQAEDLRRRRYRATRGEGSEATELARSLERW